MSGSRTTGLTCYVHPKASAEDRCAMCRRTICPACVVSRAMVSWCRSCAERSAHGRWRVRVWLSVAALLLAGAAALAALLFATGCAAAALANGLL